MNDDIQEFTGDSCAATCLDQKQPNLTKEQMLMRFIRDTDARDGGFGQAVADVERLFDEGSISASEAAERLGLSIREFVAEFILDDRMAASLGIHEDEREAVVNNAAEALNEELWGRSIRAFVGECVITEEDFAAARASGGPERLARLRQAVSVLPTDMLGLSLRRAMSVGYTLEEFVETVVFTQDWLAAAGIDDEEERASLFKKALRALSAAEEFIFNAYWFSAPRTPDREIPDDLVEELSEAIAARQVGLTTSILAKWDCRRMLVFPTQKNAAALLDQFAQWIDFDFTYLPKVEAGVEQFRRMPRSSLASVDSLHLDIAEGLVSLHNENFDEAISYFNSARRAAHKIKAPEFIATCLYYLARAYWKKGIYSKALRCARRAKRRRENVNPPEKVAVIKMVEGWLLFLNGDRKASQVLAEATEVLVRTDDFINHGNALSFQGRLHKEGGAFAEAMGCFRDAIAAYQKAEPRHRNIARTYVNMADVCYLKARLLSDPESRPEVLRLRDEAYGYLEAAEEIYGEDPGRHHRGLGEVHNTRALLYSAAGEFENANAEVEKAYLRGKHKGDHLLMGKAKKNQCLILNERQQSIKASPVGDAAAISAALEAAMQQAFRSADQALDHAEKIENRHLKARCYICLGYSLVKVEKDYKQAHSYYLKASDYLTEEEMNQGSWRANLEKLQLAIGECQREARCREALEMALS
jgi:tetratricopeptide (TPR) repeat protein